MVRSFHALNVLIHKSFNLFMHNPQNTNSLLAVVSKSKCTGLGEIDSDKQKKVPYKGTNKLNHFTHGLC